MNIKDYLKQDGETTFNKPIKIEGLQPLLEDKELEKFYNYIDEIVNRYSKLKVKEKDQILTQRIIMKQKEKIERLNEELNCYKFPSCKSDDIEVVRLNLVDMMRKNKRLEQENERLNNITNELEKYLEEEKDRLARETSNIYEDSLGETRLVNEDIFNEIILVQDKIMSLKGDGCNG